MADPQAGARHGAREGWAQETLDALEQLDRVRADLTQRYVGRGQAARLLVLAAVCREHMLLLGPPGTAKTDLVTRFARLIKAEPFSYLLSRFTEPAEIFGPLDYTRFQQGEYHVETKGMLPSAEIAFLDELFQGSSAILNTLLALLNERVFHNGATPETVPLISLFGASNRLPEDPALNAFGDRFLLRLDLEPVAQTDLPDLLESGWAQEIRRLETVEVGNLATMSGVDHPVPLLGDAAALRRLYRTLREVRLDRVRADYTDLIRDLLSEGVALSDRRVVRGQKLVAGAALLRKARQAAPRDLWPLMHLWTEPGDKETVARLVTERTGADGGSRLEPPHSAAQVIFLAEDRARSVLANGSGPLRDPDRVIPVVRDLHRLYQELWEYHRQDGAALERLRSIQRDVSQLLEDPR